MSKSEKNILKALSGEVTPNIPFWLMRQAGRYLPEYMELRSEAGSFLDLCFNPDFAAEVTLQPLRRFDMDAAILFSDILVVPYAMGQELSFVQGEGPRLGKFKTVNDFKETDMAEFNKKLEPVYQTIRNIKKELANDKTLIGFAGAPWTIACYMVQGYGDKEFNSVKQYAFNNLKEFDKLIDILVKTTSNYLIEQIKSGVDCVQIFDSWAGLLPEAYFERWVINPTKKIVDNIHREYPNFPVIGFPKGAGMLYQSYASNTGVQGLGIDQFASLKTAVNNFGDKVTLQGNLDPVILLTGGKVLEEAVIDILKTAGNNPFIFNLGHGIIKETPPEHVAQLAKLVKNYAR